MDNITQHIVVKANTPEGAIANVASLLPQACMHSWYKTFRVDGDPEVLTEDTLDSMQAQRYLNFQYVSPGLDIQRVSAAIWAYGDDSVERNGRLRGDIKERFSKQVDKILEVVTFVAERWNKDIVVFDISNNTGSIDDMRNNIANDPGSYFSVPVNFML